MNRSMVRLYPKPWRDEYGAEFMEALDATPTTPIMVIDVVWGAVSVQVRRHATWFVWIVALLAATSGEALAVTVGATGNIIWPPTSTTRAGLLIITFLPIAWAVSRTRQAWARP